jgi:hypothetical protein
MRSTIYLPQADDHAIKDDFGGLGRKSHHHATDTRHFAELCLPSIDVQRAGRTRHSIYAQGDFVRTGWGDERRLEPMSDISYKRRG